MLLILEITRCFLMSFISQWLQIVSKIYTLITANVCVSIGFIQSGKLGRKVLKFK